jgi:hypothetical protein
MMVFRLTRCALGAEVPLLPHDFMERLPAIGRPTQDYSCVRSVELTVQPDPPERGWAKAGSSAPALPPHRARPGNNADSIG